MNPEFIFSPVSRDTDPTVLPAKGQTVEITAGNVAALTPLAEALTGNTPQVGDVLTIPDVQRYHPYCLVYITL